jgi:putative ABC transport system permease protein
MFTPLLDDYAALVEKSMIANYQYVLKEEVETASEQAEKYCLSELETMDERYMTDEVSIYGIADNSRYITEEIPAGKVLASNGVMEKYGLKPGDTFDLKAPYEGKVYHFTVAGEYTYDAGLALFISREDYLQMFDEPEDFFTGYFTNELLNDIEKDKTATIITKEDMTKISRQLKVSMGDFMVLFGVFGVIMFVLLMFILSKQIIEKNAQSISMTKILGFRNTEIGGLYIMTCSIVVLVSLLAAVPMADALLRWMFSSYIYTEMTGYIPYIVSNDCFVFMVVLGILCYLFVAALQFIKIQKIPKSDALKNVE